TSKYYRAMFAGACAGIIRKWVDNNFAESEEEMVEIFSSFPG
ncbi:MAG: TetR family transcriptional regulator C-terminal domain-containing protein, partial [Clostridia bacterium]|nr:TetR family transcriptional regulator C-terminal domain-containing protein [Clostridia bacterium]